MSSSIDPSSSVGVLKMVAGVQRQVFHQFLLVNWGHIAVGKLEVKTEQQRCWLSNDTELTSNLTVYTVHCDYGADVYQPLLPAGTNQHLLMGYMKWNLCDFVVHTFLPNLQSQLAVRLPGSKVEWLRIKMVPMHVFRDVEDANLDTMDPFHSVFLVTLAEGDQYVIDFTIEQYGFDDDCWFMPAPLYRMITDNHMWSICDPAERETFYGEWLPCYVESQKAMRKVCTRLDWVAMEMNPIELRSLISWTRSQIDIEDEQKTMVQRAYA